MTDVRDVTMAHGHNLNLPCGLRLTHLVPSDDPGELLLWVSTNDAVGIVQWELQVSDLPKLSFTIDHRSLTSSPSRPSTQQQHY